MKAMIFAAGTGSRLMPLTRNKPKALVQLNSKPLLQILIEKLINSGVTEVIVNVHHFSDQIIAFLEKHKNFGIRIEVSDESEYLLDTGGGIQKASWFFDDGQPFLVHNVDVITNLDLKKMFDHHLASKALATLAVRNRETSRYLLFDESYMLCGWENIQTEEKILVHAKGKLERLAFSGIHILNPEMFEMMTETGKFSIINAYLRLAKKNIIRAYPHDHSTWKDVGKPRDLKDAESTYESLI